MRALTVTQPWAGLIASGIKLVENRSRRMAPRDLFGQRFAIHAGRAIDHSAWPGVIRIAPETAIDFPGPMAPGARIRQLAEITSSVIAVAILAETIIGEGDIVWHDLPDDQRRWFFGPIGYVLRDVIALPTPVPCRGWQGFWTLPADVERAVKEQL